MAIAAHFGEDQDKDATGCRLMPQQAALKQRTSLASAQERFQECGFTLPPQPSAPGTCRGAGVEPRPWPVAIEWPTMRWEILAAACLILAGCGDVRRQPASGYEGWETYGGGPEQLRYSRLTQIHPGNVSDLEAAWRYTTGDESRGSQIQCNPLVVDGLLYGWSPSGLVFALNAASGEEVWTRRLEIDGVPYNSRSAHRGFMHWRKGQDSRIYASVRHLLYALDARTGETISEFGDGGAIDLRRNLPERAMELSVSLRTPGVVYRDFLVVGSVVSESLPSAPGYIRAFDAATGALRWTFHTIPHPGEPGYETWPEDGWKRLGGANSWAGMAVDMERGLVYAGTGSAAFDFWGGNRPGDNLYANSLLCLRAETGELVWHRQLVRHDVWDMDLPTPPVLVTAMRDGRLIDAVSVSTKMSYVYVFDRATGESLFPLREMKVAESDVPGEQLAESQLVPVAPPPLGRQRLTEADLTNRTPEAREAVLKRFRQVRSDGMFTPMSLQGTVVFPGFDGGAEWGGQAFDPESGLLYVNVNEMAWIHRLVEQAELRGMVNGKRLYQQNCAACHLDDLGGAPPAFPALEGLGLSRGEFLRIVRGGSERMPAFPHLSDAAAGAIARFVLQGEAGETVEVGTSPSSTGVPYTHDGYNRFLDPDGYPAILPPWGTLNAVNLDSGEIDWTVRLGEFPELTAQGVPVTGTENYGGPVVTASGLLFIGATSRDKKFRAFDKATGELLWETTLPAGGNATPAVYQADGRQFVVIAAGGGKTGGESGSSYVAFALPTDAASQSP